jgi:glycosyltransferase involved in cell wall biosynthesis
MLLDDITVVILTRNEEPNIGRCLSALNWANRILVVDSGSTDETIAICGGFQNVVVIDRPFDNHTNQWNFGLDQCETPWVLCFDADYVCPPTLAAEIATLDSTNDAFFSRFRYMVYGRPLTGTLYPPRAVLFRRDRLRYIADGHTQLLDVSGAKTGMLNSVIQHDDRKPLSRWLNSQAHYAALEADKLLLSPPADLGWKDRLRLNIVIAPVLTAAYCLFWRLLILDGTKGLFYTLQRTYAELLLSIELLDRKLQQHSEIGKDH